ncbi:MAG: hypothetical protein M3326_05820, partial [Actinomycetota bacterium]|nr:hypothetical protein [Actinomycetota bacterium]
GRRPSTGTISCRDGRRTVPATLFKPADRPSPPLRLADDTRLLGEYAGSGCVQSPYLIRRGDGNVVEVSPLLYLVAAAVDGRSGLQDIASRVTSQVGRTLSADNVAYLIDNKLRPLGVLAGVDGPPSVSTRPRPLALTFRTAVVPPRVVRTATGVLHPLFRPPVVTGALIAFVGVDAWLALNHGVGPGVRDFASHPALCFMALALTLAAGAFHELGHATACRYGGAEPGAIGAGLYLVWPVFYNDLNDSYRLSRRARLRADLGGVYFNAVFILGLAALYGATRFEPLLVVILVQHLAILHQLLPFLRLDGYYIVSDLAGVPNLFGRVRPVLSSLVPGPAPVVAPPALTPRARRIVTAWVLVTVPLLVAALVVLMISLPRVVTGAWSSLHVQGAALTAALRARAPLQAVLSALQIVALAVPVVALTAALSHSVRRRRAAMARPDRRPLERAPAVG